jgi:hypothetical protein
MTNLVYNHIVDNFIARFGNKNDLPSNNGTRFDQVNGVTLTVYKANIAVGNCVEIAFKPETVINLNDICSLTEHPVKPNPRYNWPRVGLRNIQEANEVIASMRE